MQIVNGATVEFLEPAPFASVGDIVQTADGKLFKVTALKQVNYQVIDEDGKIWKLRKAFTFKVPAGVKFADPTEFDAPVDSITDFVCGTVVEFRNSNSRPGRYVVLRSKGQTMALAKLGGDNGRYFASVPPMAVKIVAP